MNSQLLIRPRTVLATIGGLALVVGLTPFRGQADEWDKKTILTVSQPIQVRETVLEPGRYVLKLYDSSSQRHIVQIFNGDQSRIIDTVIAIPKERLDPTGHSQFTFWETPPGTARALRAWFYPGDLVGQEFPYPKHLKQLAMVQTPASSSIQTTTTTQTETSQAEAAPPEAPQPQTTTQEPAQEPQPVEMAQNTPPPPPAAAPEPPPAPSELPHTASPYPLIGLSGLGLLLLSGLLRLKRSS